MPFTNEGFIFFTIFSISNRTVYNFNATFLFVIFLGCMDIAVMVTAPHPSAVLEF